MRKTYMSPEADVIVFDTKDVITTSGDTDLFDPNNGLGANEDDGWSPDFY